MNVCSETQEGETRFTTLSVAQPWLLLFFISDVEFEIYGAHSFHSHFTFLQVDRRLGGNGRFLSTKSTVFASESYLVQYCSLRAILYFISLVEKHFRQCKAVFAF